MGSSDKDWERPWSMQEMIANAENWNLAGDVALLNSIKAFADNMITRSNAISDNIDDLLNNLNNVSLRLDISKNEFQSLRNVQFIESRVYEEDETLETSTYNEPKVEEELLSEEAKNAIIKNSVSIGLNVMDKYFDKIHTHNAEGEIETRLQARNLYAHRPLPPLIGSAEWSEMFEPDASENNSTPTSENEIETENSLNVKSSETSSELDLTSKSDLPKPLLNSTLNESSESVSQDLAINTEQSMSFGSKSFADELASKLGTVLNTDRIPDAVPEINTKPIQKAPVSSRVIGDLFADEPPPLDNFEDGRKSKSTSKGLFSGGEGLFDEDEDDLFKTDQPNKPVLVSQVPKNLFDDDDEPPLVNAPTDNASGIKSNITKGLFDSDDSGDDDIFSTIKNKPSKPPLLQPLKTNAPLFDEEPPVLEEAKSKPPNASVRKEPVGGVSQIFPELQKKLATNRRSSSESNDSKSSHSLESNSKESKKVVTSLFDDDDENGDLFQSNTTHNESKPPLSLPNLDINENQPKKLNLFDDEDDDFASVPIKHKIEEVTKIPPKKVDLFSDEDDDLFGGDLFGKKPVKSSLFDDDDDDDLFTLKVEAKPTVSNVSNQIPVKEVIEEVKEESKEAKNDSSFDSFITNKPSDSLTETVGKTKSLFDDSDGDDLFAAKTNRLFEEDRPNVETTPKKVNVFDSVPPPVDDSEDWDTKSEHAYDDSDHDEFVTQQSNLFDKEPPLLVATEKNDKTSETNTTLSEDLSTSSNNLEVDNKINDDNKKTASETDGLSFSINKASENESNNMEQPKPKPSPGKLKHNLNINVNALMPGYVPRPKQLVKSVSLDLESDPSSKAEESNVKNSEKATGFDSQDTANVLHSVTKDRARPANRRLPSRRGRQELLRQSVPDFALYPNIGELDDIINNDQIDNAKEIVDKVVDKIEADIKDEIQVQDDKTDKPPTESVLEGLKDENKQVENRDNTLIKTDIDIFGGGKQSPLFDDIQDEDIFKTTPRESITKDENVTKNLLIANQPESVGECEETVIAGTSAIITAFEDKDSDDSSLFPNLETVPKKKLINTPKSDSFFDSPDSDDDLFSSTTSKSSKSNNETKTKLDNIFISDKSKETPLKQDIFGSESDEDDIFSTNKTPKSKKTEKKALFDDDSNDEDDIFGSAKSVTNQTKNEFITKNASRVSTIRTSNIRKLENVEAVEDPLSDLLK